MSQQSTAVEVGGTASHGAGEHAAHRLGALLCWAVVFADIGTSVYYVPGILFGSFHQLAGFFVTLTLVAFVLLALKYAEVSVRFPEGGGVVTVSARALNPWMGALGGMFILVDYFLTAAISSLSGLQYFQDVFPPVKPFVLILTVIVLALLGVLNWWGIRESAMVSLYIAVAAFVSDIVVMVAIGVTVPFNEILLLIKDVFSGQHLTTVTVLTGFAGAFLAFSGLESISQLSPVMQRPRSKVVSIALTLVVFTVGITSPLLTILATTLLDGKHNHLLAHPIAKIDPNQFISQLGTAAAGPVIGIATAVIASALLIFASNTAIIGTYHVFLALARMSFFPSFVEKTDKFRQTPFISIALATGIPIAILIFVNGQIDLLGQLYAFGLLGAFMLTSLSVDVLRIRERRGGKQATLQEEEEEAERAEQARLAATNWPAPVEAPTSYSDVEDEEDEASAAQATAASATAGKQTSQTLTQTWTRFWPTINFALGFLTTALVLTAWMTNLVTKHDATIFGGSLTVVGMGIAIAHYNSQRRAGKHVIQPAWALSYTPESVFAITRTGAKDNDAVIESAFRAARGRKVLVLFLSSHIVPPPRFMQITDPASRDDEAQDIFRLAVRLSEQSRTPIQVYYRIGGVTSAAAFWRVTRSEEVVADAATSKEFAGSVAPTYIRYRRQGEADIAYLIVRASASETQPPTAMPSGRRGLAKGASAKLPEYERSVATDEIPIDLDLQTPVEPTPAAPVRAARPAVTSQPPTEEPQYGEPPVRDHEHDGDTSPRHKVKIMSGQIPGSSGVQPIPRPTPQVKDSTKMTEPMVIESDDDDWYWNGEDYVPREQPPATESGASDHPDSAKE